MKSPTIFCSQRLSPVSSTDSQRIFSHGSISRLAAASISLACSKAFTSAPKIGAGGILKSVCSAARPWQLLRTPGRVEVSIAFPQRLSPFWALAQTWEPGRVSVITRSQPRPGLAAWPSSIHQFHYRVGGGFHDAVPAQRAEQTRDGYHSPETHGAILRLHGTSPAARLSAQATRCQRR